MKEGVKPETARKKDAEERGTQRIRTADRDAHTRRYNAYPEDERARGGKEGRRGPTGRTRVLHAALLPVKHPRALHALAHLRGLPDRLVLAEAARY